MGTFHDPKISVSGALFPFSNVQLVKSVHQYFRFYGKELSLYLIYLVKQIRNIFQYFRDQFFRENTFLYSKTGILNLCYDNLTNLLMKQNRDIEFML